ncbi:MAG: hypothetical protein AAF561_15245, partial [Planctomycetota bacterium]
MADSAHNGAPARTRPMRTIARGKRRPRSPSMLAIVVPVVSPKRASDELRVLMKPHDWTRNAVRHRVAIDAGKAEIEQPWQAEDAGPLVDRAIEAAGRLSLGLTSVEPESDERLRLEVEPSPLRPEAVETRLHAIALACSFCLPKLWLLAGRLAVHDCRFWRLARGATPHWVEHKSKHLTREDRATLR